MLTRLNWAARVGGVLTGERARARASTRVGGEAWDVARVGRAPTAAFGTDTRLNLWHPGE